VRTGGALAHAQRGVRGSPGSRSTSATTPTVSSAATRRIGSLTGMVMNLDDTSRCPVGRECESCGRLDELAVSTVDTPAGVICMTVCDACELLAVLPVLSPAEEAASVREHGKHVGFDVDAGSPP
jgi:hypothetical protein